MRAKQGGNLYHFIMVFGVTLLGHEPATYCMRGRNANHLASSARCENKVNRIMLP